MKFNLLAIIASFVFFVTFAFQTAAAQTAMKIPAKEASLIAQLVRRANQPDSHTKDDVYLLVTIGKTAYTAELKSGKVVSRSFGAEINPTCWQGNLKLATGGEIPFYWWQWYTSSRISVGDGSSRPSYKNFLAVSFPPNIVSAEFEQKAIRAIQTDDFSQKFVNALVVDSQTPIRAEKLADGSFLICWQVSEKAKVLKEKLDWLKNNVTVRNQTNSTNKGVNKNMNYQVAAADVILTLMMIQPNGDFAPSSTMTYPYFFLVPETFAANLLESSKQLMYQIYDEHYDAFKLREPNDPNYIAVVEVTPRILTAAEYSQMPWLAARMPAWENSNCLVIQNNSYQKVEPKSFGGILGLGTGA